ncbi:MAG: DNA-binding transcriptional regulator [Polyangiaceae bacterium]|nr:DNA-binding transcriptional regulator [Polyangiaceae bacterium]
MLTRRSVIVKVPLSVGHGRAILEGVSEYARNRKDWWITVLNEEATVEVVANAQPSGVIAFTFTREIEDSLRAIGVPVVSVANTVEHSLLPAVYFDDHEAGRLAAEHLMTCGLRHYAFMGDLDPINGRLRLEGFRAALERAGHSVAVLECTNNFSWIPFNPEDVIRQLVALPKPCGVFAPWDLIAYHVARVCEHASIRVPEEIAIIGVDNDPLLCNVSRPPLTSVRIPAFEIGFRAAEMLDHLMTGGAVPEQPVILPPLPPVVRQSTEVIAVPDEKVAMALRYVREHAHESVGVTQMWEALAVDRKEMEARFRKFLGRSAGQEFTRVRVERAKQLALDTNYTAEELARACGFATASYLISVFRKHVGVTPQAYRETFRRVPVAS